MTSEHIRTKHKIRKLTSRGEFEMILSAAMLTEDEAYIIRAHYCEKRALYMIANDMDYAESTVRLKHRQALEKIARLI